MKKILNKFAIWLYNKTKKSDIPKTIGELFGGLRVFENRFLPKGQIHIGMTEMKKLREFSIDKELNK